jgi:hypothetical protein
LYQNGTYSTISQKIITVMKKTLQYYSHINGWGIDADDLIAEHGLRSELQFNKVGLAKKVLTVGAVITFAVLLMKARSRDDR